MTPPDQMALLLRQWLDLSRAESAAIQAAAWPKLLARNFAPDTLEPMPQLRLG